MLVPLAGGTGTVVKVERPFRYIREEFFLAGSFRNLDDLNAQLRQWLDGVANARLHATTQRVVNEAFVEERLALKPLPLAPYRTVLKLERRVSHEGLVSVAGNLYSVPDATRRRILDVHVFADEICIIEDGVVVARHVPLDGRNQKHVDPEHRKLTSLSRARHTARDQIIVGRAGDRVARRSLDFYDAVGRRLADRGGVR